MVRSEHVRALALAFLIAIAAPVAPAFAYIDPNIGGQIYQAIYPIIALLVGVVAFARQWVAAAWHALVARVKAVLPGTRADDRDAN